jgi:hypothetical protein
VAIKDLVTGHQESIARAGAADYIARRLSAEPKT